MSSSNEVRLAYIKETVYNTTPAAGNFREMRFVSEGLTGTPITVMSEEMRSDRQSGGQSATGLEVNGPQDFKLSADQSLIDMTESAMMDSWSTPIVVTEAGLLTVDVTAGTVTAAAEDFDAQGIVADTLVRLAGMDDALNNTVIYVVSAVDQVITFIGPDTMVDGTGTGATVNYDKFVEIGTTRTSYSIEKNFTDLTDKTISYTGMRVASMNLEFAFGQDIKGSFGYAGAGWATPTTPMTDSRTVTAAGSAPILNAAVNMGMIMLDGALITSCIETLGLVFDNNIQPQNCIGKIAPSDQIPFEASLGINLTTYLGDGNFDFLEKKISQTPVEIIFFTQDVDGHGFAYHIPAMQLSFPDPAATGKNTHVMMEMAGIAKYDSTFGNTMRIYSF